MFRCLIQGTSCGNLRTILRSLDSLTAHLFGDGMYVRARYSPARRPPAVANVDSPATGHD